MTELGLSHLSEKMLEAADCAITAVDTLRHRQLVGWLACEMELSQVAGWDDNARCSQLRRLPLPG